MGSIRIHAENYMRGGKFEHSDGRTIYRDREREYTPNGAKEE